MLSVRRYFNKELCLLLVLAFASQLVGTRSTVAIEPRPTSTWEMPDSADVLHMTWVKGPPAMQAFNPIDKHLSGFREDAAELAFRSGRWGMLFNPRMMELSHLTRSKTADAKAELLDYDQLRSKWSISQLNLAARIDGKIYRAVGGAIPSLKEDYSYSPIHIVESGSWYQHVAIYDLDLVDADGELLPAKSWFEIRAWGDRCHLQWFVEPESGKAPELRMELKSEQLPNAGFVYKKSPVVELSLNFSEQATDQALHGNSIRVQATTTDEHARKAPSAKYSNQSGAWEVSIPRQVWRDRKGVAFNPEYLDRQSNYDLSFENASDEPYDLRLRLLHDYHPISGYVPLMYDADGVQTGLPLQNSKNWHVKKGRPFPYEGSWIHVSTRMTLAPHSKVDLDYIIAHAQWHGLPASSVAQLSLVGWGYNGFWTQMALGSWGETLCVQAGRTMRRAFITDVRPFLVKGKRGDTYDWTNNVGGADIAKVVDSEGKLVVWQGAVQEYDLIGPNLSHFRVTERSASEQLRLTIDTFLPRSDSINRSYFKVRLDALEDFDFQELALFQLGSDYYNSMRSRKIGWGSGEQLTKVSKPEAAKWGHVSEPVALAGSDPWVSLFDNPNESSEGGSAVRGIILRQFEAKIGCKTYTEPWVVAGRTKSTLNADITLSPEVTHLNKGDRIEFTVELVIFPFAAKDYYGPDQALKARLAKHSDSWELTAHEAANVAVQINGVRKLFPATIDYDALSDSTFSVSGSGGLATVLLTGLPSPTTFEIVERLGAKNYPLGERISVEAGPQYHYDINTQTWTAVLALELTDKTEERVFMLHIKNQ